MNKAIHQCLAASNHCDASMDRTQKDNEMMLLKMINEDGSGSLMYVGVGFVRERGEIGHRKALKEEANGRIGF